MASDFDEGSADIPIWGWLSGANARLDREQNKRERTAASYAWRQLMEGAPTAGELTPDYQLEGASDEYGDLLGGSSQLEDMGPERSQLALDALRGIIDSGGYTDADRQAAAAARSANAQQVGAMNQAALRGLEARGAGGSGAAMAAQLGGSQTLANANMQSDAAMQQAAMNRALAATQNYGSLATQMRGQEMARRQALDAYNQANMDWRRGRTQRNTGWQNRQQDANTQARQQAHQNQEYATAGLTGQYTGNQSRRQQDARRQDEADAAGAGVVGSIIDKAL